MLTSDNSFVFLLLYIWYLRASSTISIIPSYGSICLVICFISFILSVYIYIFYFRFQFILFLFIERKKKTKKQFAWVDFFSSYFLLKNRFNLNQITQTVRINAKLIKNE
jgi:hypothetical protein